MVNVDEYRITADTAFVADITYKYDVKFMADGKVHNSQIVEKHAKPTVPSNPTKRNMCSSASLWTAQIPLT